MVSDVLAFLTHFYLDFSRYACLLLSQARRAEWVLEREWSLDLRGRKTHFFICITRRSDFFDVSHALHCGHNFIMYFYNAVIFCTSWLLFSSLFCSCCSGLFGALLFFFFFFALIFIEETETWMIIADWSGSILTSSSPTYRICCMNL